VLTGHTDSVTGLDLSADGETLVSNAMDGTCRVWDVRSFFVPPPDFSIAAALPGQDASQFSQLEIEGAARCLTTVAGGHKHNFEKNLLRCRWSRDGDYFGVGSSDRQVYIYARESGALTWRLPGHEGSVNCVAFHPKEDIVCSASSDKTLFLGELGD